jgi:predicted GNAT superfamily acetyltransferase
MEIREISKPEEMKHILPVASSAWGEESAESMVADMLRALSYHGGLVLGAYENEKLIGFQFSFIGQRKGIYYLYSHMTGVVNEKKGSGIGFMLKQKQREWALEHGFDLIAWTFDPLMSLNAHFNIRKLGAIARSLYPNFYGEMHDALNRGLETDRFFAEWWLHCERATTSNAPVLTKTSITDDGFIRLEGMENLSSETLAVEIPADLQRMKLHNPPLAAEWRKRSRDIFSHLFREGYAATDFVIKEGRCFYIFTLNYTQKDRPLLFG